jgi:hypothetical protein
VREEDEYRQFGIADPQVPIPMTLDVRLRKRMMKNFSPMITRGNSRRASF